MPTLNWTPDPEFTKLADDCPILPQVPPAEQFQGYIRNVPRYASLTNDNNAVLDSTPNAILQSAQDGSWRTFLIQVAQWGHMIPGPLNRPFQNIYQAANPDQVAENRLIEIENTLEEVYDGFLSGEEFEQIWNRLQQLGWTRVIASKCLHFMARAANVEGVIPVALDNAMSKDWLWMEGFKSTVEDRPGLNWPRPGGLNHNDYRTYNRYLSAMAHWAELLKISIGDLEIRLFASWRRRDSAQDLFTSTSSTKHGGDDSPTTQSNPPINNPPKPILWVAQNHSNDRAITLKEDCHSRWNIAWICRSHGSLSLKSCGARDLERCIIAELQEFGENPMLNPNWVPTETGGTDCMGGTAYEGWLKLGSVEAALCYLKRFYNLRACPDNVSKSNLNSAVTQEWLDALTCK